MSVTSKFRAYTASKTSPRFGARRKWYSGQITSPRTEGVEHDTRVRLGYQLLVVLGIINSASDVERSTQEKQSELAPTINS